jgi:hypothetical protein
VTEADQRSNRRMKTTAAKPRSQTTADDFDAEVSAVLRHLMEKYGPLLDRDALVAVLRFPSVGAFDRFRQRGLLQLRLVRVPNRTGVFASAHDTAKHLVRMTRQQESTEFQEDSPRHSREQ